MNLLTIDPAVEQVLLQLHPVRACAERLGRSLGELRRGQAQVRAPPVHGQAVVGRVRLPVGVVHVHNHGDLFL